MSAFYVACACQAYYAELNSHNTAVRAQVSCLDVPVLIKNDVRVPVLVYRHLVN